MNFSDFRVSKTAVFVALAYPLAVLILYYTLLVHLRLGLGRWPIHISDNPRTSLFHAHEVAAGLLFMVGVVLAPISSFFAIIFTGAPRTRRWAAGLAIFTLGCLLVYAAMHLAPHSFVTWWWD
jgi:hypothetical protein